MLEDLLLFVGLLGLVISIGMRVSLRKDGTKGGDEKDSGGRQHPNER